MPETSIFPMSLDSRGDSFFISSLMPPALRSAISRSNLSRTSEERANKASISSRVFPVAVESSQYRVMQYGIGENVGLTLRAQEVDIGCSEETAQQGPDKNLGTDSIDTSTTAEDHDEG
jgi:hypothetical protein